MSKLREELMSPTQAGTVLGTEDTEKDIGDSSSLHIPFPTKIRRPGGRKAHLKGTTGLLI